LTKVHVASSPKFCPLELTLKSLSPLRYFPNWDLIINLSYWHTWRMLFGFPLS